MSAEAYSRLEEDGYRYELIDGVVCMSPSASPRHQNFLSWLSHQIWTYLEDHPVGHVFVEVDVHLGKGAYGGDLVYRPDLVYVSAERCPRIPERITIAPDLIVEIISPYSRGMDNTTKREDYERAGVKEYWIFDQTARRMKFLRLRKGKYAATKTDGKVFQSTAIPGFSLNLAAARRALK